ncbi:MAG: TetR/AcrR family transcriptional regulator [Clostridia bacterium]|nr:TetR/AcrR family transcriptional regulator [Clostridia bacterium]
MKTDTRVKITRTIFHNALLDILREKPIHSVTVTELCQKAELNRGTFYAYYGIPDDVLAEIEDKFINDCNDIFAKKPGGDVYDFLPAVYTYVKDNIETLKILIGENSSPRFRQRIKQDTYRKTLKRWHENYPNIRDNDFEFVFDTVYTGGAQNLVKWIEGYYDFGLKELVRRSNVIISYCVDALEKMNEKNKNQ